MSINDLTASDDLKFRFATDGAGNYGYLKGDDTFVPFKSGEGGSQSITFFYLFSVPGTSSRPYGVIRNNNIETYATTQQLVNAASEYVSAIDANYFTINCAGIWFRQQAEGPSHYNVGDRIYLTGQQWTITLVRPDDAPTPVPSIRNIILQSVYCDRQLIRTGQVFTISPSTPCKEFHIVSNISVDGDIYIYIDAVSGTVEYYRTSAATGNYPYFPCSATDAGLTISNISTSGFKITSTYDTNIIYTLFASIPM